MSAGDHGPGSGDCSEHCELCVCDVMLIVVMGTVLSRIKHSGYISLYSR